MALAGVGVVVTHTSTPEAHENIPAEAIFDFNDRVLSFHSWRASKYFIETYACVCVSMVGVPVDYKAALDRLPGYLSKDRIVGIGETGLEPGSATCSDLKVQEEILRAQLVMAKKHGKTVALHTPLTEKSRWVTRYLDMVNELGLNPERVVIDHADQSVVGMITRAGCYAGITVQPWRRVRPVDAAKAVEEGDMDRILVDSDCSFLESDPLAVPKTGLEMRKLGMGDDEVRRVLWENPQRAYGLA
jgi:hypothetical protein